MSEADLPVPEPRPSLLERLGPRAVRRMTPRVGVALAGAGAIIAIGGATGIGGNELVTSDGDVQRVPGILISAAVIMLGYVTLARMRTGALASAGATAAALGVPLLLFFLTFDVDDFPPFSLDAILAVSTIAWLVAYVVGPGAGRLLLLGLALAGSWLFVLNLLEPVENLGPFGLIGLRGSGSFESSEGFEIQPVPDPGTPTFDADGNLVFPEGSGEFAPFPDGGPEDLAPIDDAGFGFEAPDFTDVAVVSLLFGAVYAAAAFVLSRRGYFGAGTPFTAVGIAALVLGVQLLAPDLEQIGTGILAIVLGLGLAVSGAASMRRVTAWIGAAGVGIGAVALLEEGVRDSDATAQSIAYLLLGLAVVLAGHLVGIALREPDEEVDAPTDIPPGATGAGHLPGPGVAV